MLKVVKERKAQQVRKVDREVLVLLAPRGIKDAKALLDPLVFQALQALLQVVKDQRVVQDLQALKDHKGRRAQPLPLTFQLSVLMPLLDLLVN